MSRAVATRKYGKQAKRSRPALLFAEMPSNPGEKLTEVAVSTIIEKLNNVNLDNVLKEKSTNARVQKPTCSSGKIPGKSPEVVIENADQQLGKADVVQEEDTLSRGLSVLTWADLCPPGDRIEKIAEASYAEVYRVTNERGTSIIKAIRLESPIRAQTKAQKKSGLVDEEPHSTEDLSGELCISEWLADIPGFVVYKERYVVQGRATRPLLDTHQSFQRRIKRQDPERLQFYPSPSRYLDETRFLVVELGDAGIALEDFKVTTTDQLWDIFLHTCIALARAEDQIHFEHRDLHEGNLCVRQVRPPRSKEADDESPCVFGFSGLEVTILDYGLSRAEDPDSANPRPIAYDLEKDLGLFTSTHAAQCEVYRRMRSFLLVGDRIHLPPESHHTPHDAGLDGTPISWKERSPYTNVLWLAYIYEYLTTHFTGDASEDTETARKRFRSFRRTTRELWSHLDPDALPEILSFPSACDVVRYAVEAGWITDRQLAGAGGWDDSRCSELVVDESQNASIIEIPDPDAGEQATCAAVAAETADSAPGVIVRARTARKNN